MLNKRTADQESLFCLWLFSCIESMSPAAIKSFEGRWLCNDCHRASNVFGDVNVGAQNRNFSFPLNSNTNNNMIVRQKMKFMLERAL